MEQINKEFNVPYYIFEEIAEYIELTAKGYSKCMKWKNIKSLLKLAVKQFQMLGIFDPMLSAKLDIHVTQDRIC